MTFDISLEAIEADLALADRDPGGRLSNLALAKAQIRATLLAAGVTSGLSVDQAHDPMLTELLTEPFDQRLRAASDLLALPPVVMKSVLHRAGFEIPGGDPLADPSPVHPSTEEQADAAADVAGIIIDGPTEPDEEDDDFFAEARRERD